MEERNNLIILYDYYQGLLTNKQKQYFELYYFDNLSLSEMSENLNISRNAIHKVLKNITNKLNFYEETLKIKAKSDKLKKITASINDKELQDKIKKIYEEDIWKIKYH